MFELFQRIEYQVSSIKKSILFVTVLLFITQTLFAQSEFIVIDSILIDGNKRTRTENALRELSFSVGDTVRNVDLTKLFKQNELLLKSTGLFSKVIITNISKTPPSSTINIVVEEAWYIYPLINISFAELVSECKRTISTQLAHTFA